MRVVRLSGQVGHPDFLPWMGAHARKLGLKMEPVEIGPHRVELTVAGAPEMIDAFALASSLGPRGVWVDTVSVDKAAPYPANR